MDDKKEVYYAYYCNKCKHKNLKESEDPCDECLSQPYNIDSNKPINFKEKK